MNRGANRRTWKLRNEYCHDNIWARVCACAEGTTLGLHSCAHAGRTPPCKLPRPAQLVLQDDKQCRLLAVHVHVFFSCRVRYRARHTEQVLQRCSARSASCRMYDRSPYRHKQEQGCVVTRRWGTRMSSSAGDPAATTPWHAWPGLGCTAPPWTTAFTPFMVG
eukprot:366522-Chlamydomonas_euryale.AAC.25